MSPRFAPVLAVAIALIAVAGCAGGPVAVVPTAAVPSSSVSPAPDPTPFPVPSTALAEPTERPNVGGVDGGGGGPELTIVALTDDSVQATLLDPAAKAWRLVVAGTGDRGDDRWEIVVETGDVGPTIIATEVVGGKVVDEMDLSGFADGTAAAGGCHSTLSVCLDSDGFRLPDNGDGTFSVRFQLPQAQVPLVIRGGTAAWAGEPFVLGPWRDTEAFPWGEG
jgi:hypothetical protein